MKADEITIEMKAKLMVDRETAETCLKLVEMYVNQNPVYVVAHKERTGEVKFMYEEQQESKEIKATPLVF